MHVTMVCDTRICCLKMTNKFCHTANRRTNMCHHISIFVHKSNSKENASQIEDSEMGAAKMASGILEPMMTTAKAGGRDFDKSNVECYRYHKFDHYRSKCRTRLPNEKEEKSDFAENKEGDTFLMVVHAKTSSRSKLFGRWIPVAITT